MLAAPVSQPAPPTIYDQERLRRQRVAHIDGALPAQAQGRGHAYGRQPPAAPADLPPPPLPVALPPAGAERPMLAAPSPGFQAPPPPPMQPTMMPGGRVPIMLPPPPQDMRARPRYPPGTGSG